MNHNPEKGKFSTPVNDTTGNRPLLHFRCLIFLSLNLDLSQNIFLLI